MALFLTRQGRGDQKTQPHNQYAVENITLDLFDRKLREGSIPESCCGFVESKSLDSIIL